MLRRVTRPHCVRRTSLFVFSFSMACATPPTREMDQAQGAIDAARAAGADRYATEQYEAAVKALQSAHEAVGAARLSPGAEPRARQPRSRADAAKEAAASRRRSAAPQNAGSAK